MGIATNSPVIPLFDDSTPCSATPTPASHMHDLAPQQLPCPSSLIKLSGQLRLRLVTTRGFPLKLKTTLQQSNRTNGARDHNRLLFS